MADVLLNIRVIPRAKRSGVDGKRGDAWVVRLNAPPVEGAANDALVAWLAKMLAVPRRAITIVAGERSRDKRVRIDGIDADAAYERLKSATARS